MHVVSRFRGQFPAHAPVEHRRPAQVLCSDPLPRDVAAARRPVARIRRTSSTVRAGVTGATGRLDHRQPCEPACFEATRALRVSRSRTIRPLERLRYPSARPSRVIRQSRPSSAWRSTTRATAAWPGRTTQVFPRSSPDGAHGVSNPCPSQVSSRRRVESRRDRRGRPIRILRGSSLRRRRFHRSGPTCRWPPLVRPDLFSSG